MTARSHSVVSNIYCILYVFTGLYNLNIKSKKAYIRGRTCQRVWGGECREEKEGGTIRHIYGNYGLGVNPMGEGEEGFIEPV